MEQAEAEAPTRGREGLGYTALLFAFVGSACLLVLELVAARLIAPTLGVSLYTWTSVIGVVLGGVSLGNYLGGRLADLRPNRSTLGLIYAAASVATLFVLGALHFVDSLELPNSAPALIQVLWITAILFFIPSTVLGMPTPLLTRLTLHSVEEGGRVVGRIQAAAALGSIVGTFLTGFFLISWTGTRHIVVGVAAILLIMAVLASPRWLPGRVYELGSLLALILVAGWASSSPCTDESDYYCIRVEPGTVTAIGANGQKVRVTPSIQRLYLDRLIHSEVNTADPTDLLYDYETAYAAVMQRLFPTGSNVDSFFIGGGGYTFPRWVEKQYVGPVTVAEIDPAVTRIAKQKLGLKPSTRLTIRSEDARRALRDLPASAKYDVVFGDAFNDYGVPFHLTTREFNALVARHLKPNGVYLVNIIDAVHHDFLRSELATLRRTFPYVGVMLVDDVSSWPPGPGRSTFVIVAAKQKPGRTLPVVAPAAVERFLSQGHRVVLTDDHVPVDQLLAPVFQRALTTGH